MTTVSAARRDWEDGAKRFADAARERARHDALHAQLDAILDEIRRRIGTTFMLAELAALYEGSERWARETIEEHAPAPGWPRTLAITVDAAFHRTSRGAVDYTP